MPADVVLGGVALGVEGLAGEVDLTPPTVVITSPASGTVQPIGTVTVTWSYNSTVPRAQYSYRVMLSLNGSGAVVYDSGTVVSSNNFHTTSYSLLPATGYIVTVYVSDIFLTSTPSTVTIYTDDSDPLASVVPLDTVGTVYEVGINGRGFMLADMVDPQDKYRRQLLQLSAPRFSTSQTPFSESFDRYTFLGFSDFSGGMGQQYRDRADSDTSRYLDSLGVNPFIKGRLSLLPSMSRSISLAYSSLAESIVIPTSSSNVIAYQTGASEVTFLDSALATTPFTTPITVETMTSTPLGRWFVANSAGHIASADSTVAAMSDLGAPVGGFYKIFWVGDRIAALAFDTGPTHTIFTTITEAGTEEVGGGRLTLTDAGEVGDIAAGGGMVYFSNGSSIFGWQIGSTAAPTELFKIPTGGWVSKLLYIDGNLFAWVWKWKAASKRKATIYRFAVQSQTSLIPSIVCRLGDNDTIDYGRGGFATDGENVIFPWQQMVGTLTGGVGCINLASGGYARWVYQNDSAGSAVRTPFSWVNGWAFQVDTVGVYTQSGSTLSSGNLATSMVDLDSHLEKIADKISVGVNRFTATNQSLSVDYTVDSGNSYVPISGVSLAGTGSAPNVQDFNWGKRFRTIGLRINLNNLGTDVYHEKTVVALHPTAVADMVVTIPVNCADDITDMSGAVLAADSYPGAGAARARFLESLVLGRIAFQDLDWQATRTSNVFEIVACDVSSVNVKSPVTGRALQGQVAVLVLKRRFA